MHSIKIRMFFFFLFFSSTAPILYGHTKLQRKTFSLFRQLIRKIATGKYTRHHLKRYQKKVIIEYYNIRSRHTPIPIELVGKMLDALAEESTYDLLNDAYAPIIARSISLFYKTPGFVNTLSKFIVNLDNNQQDLARGHWYEIIRAYEIAQELGAEEILAFNQRIKDAQSGICREIDIVTKTRWIECKYRRWDYWDKIKPQQRKLKQQLKDQKKLVKQYNALHPQSPVVYEISSFYPFSPSLRQWLIKHHMQIHESNLFDTASIDAVHA